MSRELEQLTGLALSPDGGRLALCNAMEQVLVLDVESSEVQATFGSGDFVVDPSWSPDGSELAWVEWDVPHMAWDESRLMVGSAETGVARKVAGGNGVSVQQPRFNADGTCLGYLSDASGWMNVWGAEGPDYESLAPILTESYEHGGPLWGGGSRTWAWFGDGVVVCRNEGGRTRLVSSRSAAFDVFAGSVVASGNKMLVSTGGATLPASLQCLDSSGVAVEIARETADGVEQHGVDPTDVDWISDGAQVHGRLYRARDSDGPTPLLVWLHGGPTDQSKSTLHHRLGYFVERGWSLLTVDYRGSSGWGRAYQQALRGGWGEVDVSDTIAGVESMIASGVADPESVVVWGGSAGGFTGLHALAARPDLFAAGVFMYPVTEVETPGTHRLEAHYAATLVGPPETSRELYEERSVMGKVDRLQGPLLFFHGDQDDVVPVHSTQRLVGLIAERGIEVELQVYEGERHGWRSWATRVDELERIECFLNDKVLTNKGSAK